MKVVTPVIVDKLSVAIVPLVVKVVIVESVVRFGAVSVPALVMVPILEIVVPETVSVPSLVIVRLVPVVLPVRVVAAVKEAPAGITYLP